MISHSARALDFHSAQKQCDNHRLEIDPLHTPVLLKCHCCGATAPLSRADVHWPSSESQNRHWTSRRLAWVKKASLAIILIALVIAVFALGTRFFGVHQAAQFPDNLLKSGGMNFPALHRESRRKETVTFSPLLHLDSRKTF